MQNLRVRYFDEIALYIYNSVSSETRVSEIYWDCPNDGMDIMNRNNWRYADISRMLLEYCGLE